MDFIEFNELKNNMGIYLIVNRTNGTTYVGQTRQHFKKRYYHHQWKLINGTHDNKYLQNAWNFYGAENFDFIVKKSLTEISQLDYYEEKYIKHYRINEKCYNIQDGGQKVYNYERTDEIKRKIGEKNRINGLGRKASDETKLKMSNSHKGNKYNEKNYILNEDLAKEIKVMLINDIKPTVVADKLKIDYKLVNNILSGNAWSRVNVDGWDYFIKNRNKISRLSKEESYNIYKLYISGDFDLESISKMVNRSIHTVKYHIRKHKNAKHKTIQCEA